MQISVGGRIPMTIDEVDAAWLEAALRGSGHDVRVAGLAHTGVRGGNAAKVLVRAQYAQPAHLPDAFCVKVGMELQDPSKNLTGSTYDVEGQFYAEVAPLFEGLPIAGCYAIVVDRTSHRCALVLEDLTAAGSRFGTALGPPLDAGQVEILVNALARVHARWWGDAVSAPALAALDAGIGPENRLGRYYARFDSDYLAARLAARRGGAVPAALRDVQLLSSAFWRLADTSRDGSLCLTHYDPHLGNLFVRPDGTPGIVDWQTMRWGRWGHDISYLLGSSLEVAERRRFERDLLAGYVATLRSEGVISPPSLEQAWDEYRRSFAYGLFGWITAPEYFGYSEEFCTCYVERFGAAAVETGMLDALGPR